MKNIATMVTIGTLSSIVLFGIIVGFLFAVKLSPTQKHIDNHRKKYDDIKGGYSIPTIVIEKILIWDSMRKFFFTLSYVLEALSVILSLITVYFASSTGTSGQDYIFILCSMFAMVFTVCNIYFIPRTRAIAAQYIWRELDCEIALVVVDKKLSVEEKDTKLVSKMKELEKYMENYER